MVVLENLIIDTSKVIWAEKTDNELRIEFDFGHIRSFFFKNAEETNTVFKILTKAMSKNHNKI